MRGIRSFFVLLYAIGPLFLVPYFALRFGNWSLLLGIPISYLATFGAARQASSFYFALLGCIGFWISSGFNFQHYVTFFFLCAAWGHVMWMFGEAYGQESKRGTLESDAELAKFEQNRDAIEAEFLEYRRKNLEKQLGYDDMNAIVRSAAARSRKSEARPD